MVRDGTQVLSPSAWLHLSSVFPTQGMHPICESLWMFLCVLTLWVCILVFWGRGQGHSRELLASGLCVNVWVCGVCPSVGQPQTGSCVLRESILEFTLCKPRGRHSV